MDKLVPFNDTARIFEANQEQLLNCIKNVAESGWWLLGVNTRKFSQAFADYCGVQHCLPVANGSDALELALRTVLVESDSGEDCEVITVANAGGYVSTACRLVGLVPVYADIEIGSQLMCLDSFVNCLGPKVRAVVATHLYGGVVDIAKIRNILEVKGYEHVSIIEDCAQAHGAMLAGQRVGSLGDLATFSFYPTKNLGAMGDAGAVLTSDEALYQQIQALHQYGWEGKYKVVVAYGRNSRMDEMQAAILGCLLPLLDESNNKRKNIYRQYNEATGVKIRCLDHGGNDFVAHLAVVLSPDRDVFVDFMKSKGIAVDIHYPILDCDQSAWKSMPMRIDEHSCLKVSRKSVKKVVSLPCFHMLKKQEVQWVCQALSEWEKL